MASKPKVPMPINERAKQFLPFSAVKGLEEALMKKEKEFLKKQEISEERAMVLNEKIHKLNKKSTVTVTYYENGENIIKNGQVTSMNFIFKTLEIDDTSINLDDIIDIRLVDDE